MARTTLTNEAFRTLLAGDGVDKWFGVDIPKGVSSVEIYRDREWDTLRVRWKVKGDDAIHSMPFEQTDEAVIAVLTAMKLTC